MPVISYEHRMNQVDFLQSLFRLFTRFVRVLLLFGLLAPGLAVAQIPVASFSVVKSTGCVPFSVQFTNTSQNASSYSWNFGNGNTSNLANPVNVFASPGNYTVTLTATSASGQTHQYSLPISVIPKPAADFSVNQTSGCQNAQVFAFNNLSQNFDSCTWDFGDGTTSSQLNPSHIYMISGTFNVTLVAYNKALGCSDIRVKNALVNVLPAPQGLITVSDSVTCDLQTNFQFSATLNNAVSWNWQFGDGNTSSALNPTHQFADTGYYYPSLVLTSSNGCVDTIEASKRIHIKFNPVPVVTLNTDSGCMPLLVSCQTPYISNALYSWDLGDSTVKTGSMIFHNYMDSGLYDVILDVKYANGCEQSVNAGQVNVLPRPDFVFWFTNHTGCAPLTIQGVNNPAGTYSWLWDFGDGNSSTQQAPSHTYTTQGVYTVTLTATHANGCTYSYASGQKAKVFSPNASFITDVTTGCPPLQVNFTNTSVSATTYTWHFGDGATSTAAHPTHTYTASGSYNVMLIAQDAGGCVDTLIVPNKIVVSPPAVNYQTPPPIVGCAPYPVNFSDASGAISFLWDFGDGNTSTLSNPFHTYTEPGTYIVSLTTWMPNGGCEQHISNFQTFIIDGAEPGFTYTVSPCPPYEVTFTDTSLNAAGWQWSFGDGGQSNTQHPVHTYPGPGTYNVTLVITTPGGCSTTLQANNSVSITGLGANASAVTNDTVPPLSVQFFANSSNATWWIWSFGDGDSSTLQNPTHVYNSTGPFNISLTVGNDSCQYTYDYPPMTFGASQGGGGLGGGGVVTFPRVYHCAPYEVSFSSPDPNGTNHVWVFGDGDTSYLPNPQHSYMDSGAFVPVLYVTNVFGVVDTFVFADTFYVVKPVTDFAISAINLCTGVDVSVSINQAASSYLWNFGNGVTSTQPAASYLYPNINSSYMISLNVTDTFNCSSFVAKSFSVNATSPLSVSQRRGCANDSLSFSAGNVNYAAYLWDFGDGNTSSLKDPTHAYADSGSYHVTLKVTDINGCEQTFQLSFLIEVFDPVADFTYSAPIANCQSGAVVGFLNNLSTGSSSWLWNFGDGTTSTLFNPPQHGFYVAGYNGYYDITLIAYKNVCSDTMVVQNAVYAADVMAGFSYVVNSACVPAVAQFTDSSHDAVSWFWDFGDGDTSSLQNPAHTYLKNPTDSITLTVKDQYGCASVKTMPAPVLTEARFSVSSVGGCKPFTVNFADSSQNSISCSWLFGDGNQSFSASPVHSYQSDGFYSVALIAVSPTGCVDTLYRDSLIEVNTPIASFTADSLTGCAPMLIDFQDQSTNAVIWDWDFGNGSVSGNQMPSLIYTTPGVYDVSLTVENKFGCRDSFYLDSLVTVRGALPSFTLSNQSGCAPLTVSFNNTTIGGVTYEWTFGDGNKDSIETPIHTYTVPGQYLVSLFAYDSTGCSSFYMHPGPVVVGTSPQLTATADITSGCAPLAVQFDNGGTVADSLVWDFGDGTMVSGFNPLHVYQQPGNYFVSVIGYNADGCTDTIFLQDTIRVNQKPDADFVFSDIVGCFPFEVSFQSTSSNIVSPTFIWDFGNGDVSNLQHPTVTYMLAGTYSVSLIVSNNGGCADTVLMSDLIQVFDPDIPPVTMIKAVSVDGANTISLQWEDVSVDDIDYYIIYRQNPSTGVYDSIGNVKDTLWAMPLAVFTFIDDQVSTSIKTYSYKVLAVDRCGNRPLLEDHEAHETILLNTVAGLHQVSLKWTNYNGCAPGAYEIYRKDPLSPIEKLIATVSNDTVFIDSTAWCPHNYDYRIKAVDLCGTPFFSWSNSSAAQPTSLVSQQSVSVTRSTVVDNEYVLVEWSVPVVLPELVSRYDIFRSSDQVNYQLIATVPKLMNAYEDFSAQVSSQEYYYKVDVINVCEVTTAPGTIGSSIWLQKLDASVGYKLRWTKYVEWDSGVEYYVIEKKNSIGNWEEVTRVPGSITDWEEE